MDFPKKQAQRLMPLYLLEYSEALFENHPNPSDPWGGGSEYTAGYGINISSGDVISVDQTDIATKNDLNGYIKDNDLNYASTFRGKGVWVKAEGAYTATSYGDGSIGRSIPNQPGYTYTLPSTTGTLALTSQIPTNVSSLTNDAGYLVNSDLNNYVTNSDLQTTLEDYVQDSDLSTVATTGDYNDLLNKPTIPVVSYPVTDVEVNGVSVLNGTVAEITVPSVTPQVTLHDVTYDSDLNTWSGFPSASETTEILNDPKAHMFRVKTGTLDTYYILSDIVDDPFDRSWGYVTITGSNRVVYRISYDGATWSGNFSSTPITIDYSNVTNKPTIPTVNDATITFTQGGTTKGTITLNQSSNQTIALDAGGGGTLSTTSETLNITYADGTTGTLTVITSVTLS